MAFVPSPEQQAILTFFDKDKRNFAIDAVAGAGKTTILIELAKRATQNRIIYTAFNKSIVKDVAPKLAGTKMEAKTFHGIGMYALRKHLQADDMDVDESKYKALIKEWAERNGQLAQLIQDAVAYISDEKKRESKAKDIFKDTCKMFENLLHYMRVKLVKWNDMDALIDLIDLYMLDEQFIGPINVLVCSSVQGIMEQAEKQAQSIYKIDYTDMIYWPVYWDVSLFQYPLVMADECQDISPMQRRLVEKLIYRDGRVIAVGDPRQAIYAFTGADSDSFELTVKRFNMQVLPMTVTRRCGRLIAEHAAEIVPHFRPMDAAKDGEIVYINEGELLKHAKPGELIGCRVTSALVEACLQLIAEGRPATILGSEIGSSLVGHLDKVSERADYSFEKLAECIETYKNEMVELLTEKGKDPRHMQDMLKALGIIAERARMPDLDALREYIKGLFKSEKTSDMIVFSTIHKLKGLEADTVYILKPEILPFIHPLMSAEQMLQEMNLTYVLRTRAKQKLVYLCNPDFPIPADVLHKQLALPLEQPKPAALPALPAPATNGHKEPEIVEGEIVEEEDDAIDKELQRLIAAAPYVCKWCDANDTKDKDEPCENCLKIGAVRGQPKKYALMKQPTRKELVIKRIDAMDDSHLALVEQLLSVKPEQLEAMSKVLDLLKSLTEVSHAAAS